MTLQQDIDICSLNILICRMLEDLEQGINNYESYAEEYKEMAREAIKRLEKEAKK